MTLDYALAYAGRGWPVFILSRDKAPVANCWPCNFNKNPGPHAHEDTVAAREACDHLQCHGFYAATTDPDRIAEMVRRVPDGCLGIRTGTPSGLVVVDVDPPEGLRTLATLDEEGLLPGTLTAMTGRDLGMHLLYAHPGVKITQGVGKLGAGIDLKGDGGYFIAPPSRHPKTGRPYMWSGNGRFDYPLTPLHPTLVERLRPVERATTPPISTAPFTSQAVFWDRFERAGASPYNRLRSLVDQVLQAPAHEGNSILHWCACRAGEMVAAGEIDRHSAADALQLAAEARGRPSGEASATIASGMGKTS